MEQMEMLGYQADVAVDVLKTQYQCILPVGAEEEQAFGESTERRQKVPNGYVIRSR